MIVGIQSHEMPKLWPHVEEYFKTFEELSKGEVTAGQFLHQVLQKQRQCWVAIREGEVIACVLTEIVGNPVKAVQILFAAGKDRHEWRDAMVGEIEAWGKSQGAVRCRIVGRKGWARERKDYREAWRAIEKELGQ